jgi:hypothetical protein
MVYEQNKRGDRGFTGPTVAIAVFPEMIGFETLNQIVRSPFEGTRQLAIVKRFPLMIDYMMEHAAALVDWVQLPYPEIRTALARTRSLPVDIYVAILDHPDCSDQDAADIASHVQSPVLLDRLTLAKPIAAVQALKNVACPMKAVRAATRSEQMVVRQQAYVRVPLAELPPPP